MPKKYHLFEVYGIELEYMLIQKKSFKVSPVVDQLLTKKNGSLTSDIDNGEIGWSNELVAHVVELKTEGPTSDLDSLPELFHQNILEINGLLKEFGAQLLPTASHPLMNPQTDTELWKHSYSEVYALYNRIFNCNGHGWSNVQSTHINLPFYDDEEFGKLHAAVRVILPLIPALCASSPILDGKKTGFHDSRLNFYKSNQKEIPEMTGLVIPEAVFTKEDYHSTIFEPIKKAITPHDTENILDHHFLNSRGAIARFDRNAIEIRLVDIQECPKADIAICSLIIESLKLLVSEDLATVGHQKEFKTEPLAELLDDAILHGENSKVSNPEYLALFGLESSATMQQIWKSLYELTKSKIHPKHHKPLETILEQGTLSSRILKAIGEDESAENIESVYRKLGECLVENKLFRN